MTYSLKKKSVKVLFEDDVFDVLEDDTDVVCVDGHCEVMVYRLLRHSENMIII